MATENTTNIAVTFDNKVNKLSEVTKYERELQKIYGYINALKNPSSKATMKNIVDSEKEIDKNLKDINKNTSNTSKMIKNAFSIKTIKGFEKALHNTVKTMFQLSQKTTEYIENVNLLQVAYKNANETIEESSKRIETYIDKMSEVYGLDESRLTRQFGIFKQLANAMQLPTETAEHLSEIMVKMTNDIASLYNLDLNRASNALQSALAGQVRPIRSATGADITEKTLQNTVLDLGLDRTISELSYVEKRLIMVVSLTNQLKASQGDYARTIESASNQIRVMHEQWDRLSRSIGNVFYPILEKVLPYINAILMVLTEIANVIATLLGFKMPEFDYSGLTGVSDLALDIEEDLAGAGDELDNLANKLKGLRGFDKLNVINTPSSGASGVSIGGSGYVDPKIMDAFNNAFSNYNDMMDKVQMKATKIRDSIMEWLGFTKQVDEETGEISWKFDHITSGTVLGGLAVGGFIYSGIKKIFEFAKAMTGMQFPWLKTLGTIVGGVGLAELFSFGLKEGGNWVENNLGSFGKGLNTLNPYRDQDLFSMWNNILNSYNTTQKFKKSNKEKYEPQLLEDLSNAFGERGTLSDIEILNKYKDVLLRDIQGVTGNYNYNDDVKILKALLESKELENLPNVGFMFNQDDAFNITNVTNALKEYFNTIEQKTPNVQEYYDIIEQSDTAFKEAGDELGLFIEKMASADFELTAEDFNKINGYLEQMRTSSYESSQAFVDAVNDMTLSLLNQGYISDETAQKVIENARKKQMAENGATEDFINGMIELENQFKQGIITEKEYYQKTVDLYNQFKKTPSIVKQTTDKIDFLNKNMKITAENMGEVQQSFTDAKRYSKEALDSINADYEKNKDFLMDWLSQYEEGSEEYEDITKMIEALNQEHTDSVAEVENSYKTYLENTLNNLRNSKEGFTEEGQALIKALEDELGELGKGFDAKDGVATMISKINNSIKSLSSELAPIEIGTKIDKSGFRTSLEEIVEKVDSLGDVGLKLSQSKGSIIQRIRNIIGYAHGGIAPVGQIMQVNEHGAELVGHVGGKTFVANQNQMMDLLDKKIGNAQNSKTPTVMNFYLDADHKIGTYTLDQLQDLAKTNGQAITIG